MCTAANEMIPNNPKKLETKTVKIFIGMCKPTYPPKTLKKNRNKTPIASFTAVCPINLIGFTGVPINIKIIKMSKIIMIALELIIVIQPFLHPYYYL